MRSNSTIEFHEAANIFPLEEETLPELIADIQQFGQRVPIELLGGKILDGRRRYLACQKAGIEPKMRTVANIDDPVAYSISLNLHRRHLTPSQRAMCAARARELFDGMAKERQKASGGDRKSAKARTVQENLPEPIHTQARDQAGEAFGVSGRMVDYAGKVIKNAIPEVQKAVDEGRMAVDTAAILSSEPEDVQKKEAANPKRSRTYQSCSSPLPSDEKEGEEEEKDSNGKLKGVGIRQAYEAINCLTRIPKNDHFRKRGFQIVTDWIKHNQVRRK